MLNTSKVARTKFPISEAIAHDSAIGHVSGSAQFIDDIPTPINTLYIAFRLSDCPHGIIKSIDDSMLKNMPGVLGTLKSEDLECIQIGAVEHDQPLLAKKKVEFHGQAIVAVIAESEALAWQAANAIKISIQPLEAISIARQAYDKKQFLRDPVVMQVGNVSQAIKQSKHHLNGTLVLGGQEHFYLESHIALAIPGDKDELCLHSSTQNPTEVQKLIAEVLQIPMHSVEVVTRRMGGGFGGKETDSNQIACISAWVAKKWQQAVKCRLPRRYDGLMTGKRHDYEIDYQVGFNTEGKIQGLEINFLARCGYSLDLSYAIISRTLFHADNAYYIPNAKYVGYLCKTNTASNTAFRGFGGPQGMFAIESIMQDIAMYLDKDPCDVRQLNYYQKERNNITHYGQKVEDNILLEITQQLLLSSEYQKRSQKIEEYNKNNSYFIRGIAFSPVKFGISFTTTFLNQAGALVHVYKDGSIYVNHGGTEMGQGLFIKVAQVVAAEFGVDIQRVKSSASNTAKVPNTSATAASSGSDMNGMAAKIACQRIKKNMRVFATEHFKLKQQDISFVGNCVILGDDSVTFDDFVNLAYLNRVELFSNGYYKTPKINYDTDTAQGSPFYYFAYGSAVSEVIVDVITGEYKVLRVDILHDVGNSLNPAIDEGQVVGGFIQGMGWLTTEQLFWDKEGHLMVTGPSTYKVPAIGDTPDVFNVNLVRNNTNKEKTIFRSKAVGEPPLMLAISVWLALKDALTQYKKKHNQKTLIQLNAPATFEEVLKVLKNTHS